MTFFNMVFHHITYVLSVCILSKDMRIWSFISYLAENFIVGALFTARIDEVVREYITHYTIHYNDTLTYY